MIKSKSRKTIETFLTLFLLILFTYFIAVMVVESKNSFSRVSKNKREDEDVRIALSYVQKMILKNDRVGAIELIDDINGQGVLKINHNESWSTYVYFKGGYLYENYTDSSPDFSLSTPLVPLKDLSFAWLAEKNQIEVSSWYEYQGKWLEIKQRTTLKSVGDHNE